MSVPQQYTVLKTLTASSMPELLEDLNSNFAKLLNIYALKGLVGKDGNTGQGGSSGVRGASFMILDIIQFQNYFASPADPNEITITDINNAVAQNPIVFFQNCTNYDDIVHNDMLILPNGKVIQYNSVTGLFEETRLRLYNHQDTWTREQIIQLIEEYSQNGDGLYRPYVAKTKVISDDSPNASVINSVYNPNGVADIGVSISGDGFESKAMQYIGIQETAGIIDDNRVQLSMIDGHTIGYHEMVQNTLASGNMNAVPKPDAVPVRIMLQNQNNQGFIFGAPALGTVDKMAHIRKNTEALEIMPYYTQDGNYINGNTILSLSIANATLRSKGVTVHATDSGIALQAGNAVRVKVDGDKTTVFNKPFFDAVKRPAQSVMSVLPSGEGVAVGYKPTGTLDSLGSALPTENVIVGWTQTYVNNRLGWNTPETVKFYIDDIYSKLNAMQTDLTVLNQIAGAFKNGAVLAFRGTVIPAGWRIVTDLQGRTIVGLDPNDVDFNTIKKKGGEKSVSLTSDNNGKHRHRMRKIGVGTEGGNRWGWILGNDNETGSNGTEDKWTSEEGKGTPFKILSPYEVVNFIEFIG